MKEIWEMTRDEYRASKTSERPLSPEERRNLELLQGLEDRLNRRSMHTFTDAERQALFAGGFIKSARAKLPRFTDTGRYALFELHVRERAVSNADAYHEDVVHDRAVSGDFVPYDVLASYRGHEWADEKLAHRERD
jgi:hypothetical protein